MKALPSFLKSSFVIGFIALSSSILSAREPSKLTIESTPLNISSRVSVHAEKAEPGWLGVLMLDVEPGDFRVRGQFFGLGMTQAFMVLDTQRFPDSGKVMFEFKLGDDRSLVDQVVYLQAAAMNPRTNGLVTSNVLKEVIGSGN